MVPTKGYLIAAVAVLLAGFGARIFFITRLQRDVIRRIQEVGIVEYQTEMVDGTPFGEDLRDAYVTREWCICYCDSTPDSVNLGRSYPTEPLVPLRRREKSPPVTVQNPDPILKDIWVLRSTRYLVLRAARISNASLEYVQKLPELEYLDIGETDVDDDCLATIEKMAHLKHLCLDGTKISPNGVRRIKAALPGLFVKE